MPGLHQCPYCKYRFEDKESLIEHVYQGQGCPEAGEPDGPAPR